MDEAIESIRGKRSNLNQRQRRATPQRGLTDRFRNIYTNVYIPDTETLYRTRHENGETMAQAKLSKWGTGQGFHITKTGMDTVGASIGDAFEVEYLPGTIVLHLQNQEHRKVKRRKLTFEEVFEGWDGAHQTHDPWSGDADDLHGAEREVWEC